MCPVIAILIKQIVSPNIENTTGSIDSHQLKRDLDSDFGYIELV